MWIMHDNLDGIVHRLRSEPREPPLPITLFWALDDVDKLLDTIAATVPAPAKPYLRLYIAGGPEKMSALAQRWLEQLDGAVSLSPQLHGSIRSTPRSEAVRAIAEARPVFAVHHVWLPLDDAMPSIAITALQCQSMSQRASAIMMQ